MNYGALPLAVLLKPKDHQSLLFNMLFSNHELSDELKHKKLIKNSVEATLEY